MKIILKFLFILSFGLFSSCVNSSDEKYPIKDQTKDPTELKITKGSNFTIEELLKLLKFDISKIDNHVLSKGYHFQNTSETDSSFIINYKFYQNGFHYYFTATAPKLGEKFGTSLSWLFVDEEKKNSLDTLYTYLKTETEKKGFKLYNYSSYGNPTGNRNSANFSYKRRENPKNSYPVTFIDFNISKLGPGNMPCYGLVISTLLN